MVSREAQARRNSYAWLQSPPTFNLPTPGGPQMGPIREQRLQRITLCSEVHCTSRTCGP